MRVRVPWENLRLTIPQRSASGYVGYSEEGGQVTEGHIFSSLDEVEPRRYFYVTFASLG